MIGSLIQNKLICGGLGAVLICTAALAGSRDKYLAAVGPKPLRFQAEVPDFNPAWLLPALDMGDALAKTNAPAEPVKTPEPTSNASMEPVIPEPSAPEESNATGIEVPEESLQTVPQNEPAPTPGTTGPISSQTLLRYFSRNGTNEVLVPYNVDFTPPVPARGGESSAVYISE